MTHGLASEAIFEVKHTDRIYKIHVNNARNTVYICDWTKFQKQIKHIYIYIYIGSVLDLHVNDAQNAIYIFVYSKKTSLYINKNVHLHVNDA